MTYHSIKYGDALVLGGDTHRCDTCNDYSKHCYLTFSGLVVSNQCYGCLMDSASLGDPNVQLFFDWSI